MPSATRIRPSGTGKARIAETKAAGGAVPNSAVAGWQDGDGGRVAGKAERVGTIDRAKRPAAISIRLAVVSAHSNRTPFIGWDLAQRLPYSLSPGGNFLATLVMDLMDISPATLDDAHAVAEIHVTAWQEAYRGIIPAGFLAGLSIARQEARWREDIRHGSPQLLVARIDGRVTGWVAFGPCRDAGAAPEAGEIWAIYVAPSHWARGVGRSLWLGARARLAEQGYRSVSLWVLAGNRRAIRFYRLAGFRAEESCTKMLDLGGSELQEVRYTQEL